MIEIFKLAWRYRVIDFQDKAGKSVPLCQCDWVIITVEKTGQTARMSPETLGPNVEIGDRFVEEYIRRPTT